MHQREGERDDDGHQQGQPGIAIEGGGGSGGEGADQHLAFEADVDDAGAFRPQACKAGEDQRHRQPDGGGERFAPRKSSSMINPPP
jgi:hypothetical protein